MKPFVQTVKGRKQVEEIGFSQCHEHLFLAYGKPAELNEALHFNDYDKTYQEVNELKNNGGTLIVDAQPIGTGRVERKLVRLSTELDIDIVASTGFHRLDFYRDDHWIFAYDEAQLADVFIHEAQSGMYVGTEMNFPEQSIYEKAGMIKTAVSPKGIEERNEKMFLAAAETHRETGLPIMVHNEKGADPFQVIHFFEKENISPEHLLLCHLDRTHHDYRLHEEILQTGAFLEYDTIGRFKYHNDEVEAELIEHMIEAGFTEQLLMSLDTTRQRLSHYGGEIGLSYLIQTFLPLLRKRGCTESIIQQITVKNPQRALRNRLKEAADDET
ncbi:hypothetical protein LC040_01815 [Bacillus tianshenii]|nr:hypothetical protein LC040_01815 [Bacillus tianshenii]